MNKEEKTVVKSLATAFNALPDNKKEYLLGYAEGVAAMANHDAQAVEAEKSK